MKNYLIAFLAFSILPGCGKDKGLKDSLADSSIEKRIKGNKIKILKGNHGNTIPTNNILPCEYYPPGSPFSCNPDVVTDDPPVIYPAISFQNNYLSFNTLNDFTATYDIIDSLLENFTGYDYAMNLFSGDADKIDSLLDTRGIDESKPFVDFESRFPGYYSLRKDIETRENIFLENGGDPGSISNPENSQFIDDDVFRALLNKEGVISVENVLFKIFDNGVTYAIMNGSNALLNKLIHPDNYGLATYPDYYSTHLCKIDTNNIKLLTLPLYCEQPRETISDQETDLCNAFRTGKFSGNSGQACKLWYHKLAAPVFYDYGKKKYVSKIAVFNLFFFDVGLSKIRNYKKKNNGKWKPARTYLSAYVSENGCSLYNKNRSMKYRKFRRCAKRDVAIIPGIGGVFRGAKWLVENIISSSSGNNYYRFFKTATNYGGFYGSNYCNGTNQTIQANW